MKEFSFVILLVSVASPCAAQSSRDLSPSGGTPSPASTADNDRVTDASERLTVMTWNVEWFYDDVSGDNYSDLAKEKAAPSRSEWDWRRDAIAKSISQVKPTILALQEVESRRILWYLSRALTRNHQLEYHEFGVDGRDYFTEQDVGFLVRPPADVNSIIQGAYLKRMRSTNRFYDVSKHVIAELEFQSGGTTEQVLVMNVHLRAMPEGEPKRKRQARLIQHWIGDAIRSGKNVILLGDFNTEERGDTTRQSSDMGIASGRETPDDSDDLVDLTLRMDRSLRQTHLLEGRTFDRILCSQSLLIDDPQRPDLVFTGIEVLKELAIQGEQDVPEEHWNAYWKLPREERDLSDHFPVMATFEMR